MVAAIAPEPVFAGHTGLSGARQRRAGDGTRAPEPDNPEETELDRAFELEPDPAAPPAPMPQAISSTDFAASVIAGGLPQSATALRDYGDTAAPMPEQMARIKDLLV